MIKFTADELLVVDDIVSRRIYRLEELGLTDSKCYGLALSWRAKMRKKYKKVFTKNKN